MPEVDYSQFLYRRSVPPEYDDKRKRSRKDKPEKKPRKGKQVFVVTLCIVLCFAIVFCCVDFFAGGRLVKSVYSMMVKPEYVYYLAACSFPTREMAHAGVLAAENGGGAGYMTLEETYLVFYNLYFEKTEAENVVAKHGAYFVYELSYASSDTDLCNAIDAFLRETSDVINGVDAGTAGENALFDTLNAHRIILSSFDRQEEKKQLFLTYCLGCIDGLYDASSRSSMLHKTRHALCAVLFAARDALS